MMTHEVRTFNMKQRTPRSFWAVVIKFAVVLLVIMPILITVNFVKGELATFVTFLVLGLLFIGLIERFFRAKVKVTTQNGGINLEVTRNGLGMPVGSTFYPWESLKQYNRVILVKGGPDLALKWNDGHKTLLRAGEMEAFALHLKQICPEKSGDSSLW